MALLAAASPSGGPPRSPAAPPTRPTSQLAAPSWWALRRWRLVCPWLRQSIGAGTQPGTPLRPAHITESLRCAAATGSTIAHFKILAGIQLGNADHRKAGAHGNGKAQYVSKVLQIAKSLHLRPTSKQIDRQAGTLAETSNSRRAPPAAASTRAVTKVAPSKSLARRSAWSVAAPGCSRQCSSAAGPELPPLVGPACSPPQSQSRPAASPAPSPRATRICVQQRNLYMCSECGAVLCL